MKEDQTTERLTEEIKSFQGIWEGGYFEGDPLDPMARSGYGEIGYMSTLHVTYLTCIKPYVTEQTAACEIGPGRGAWTRCLLKSKEVWCLDALSAEHNRFWEYVGRANHVQYFQVSDFKCAMLPNDRFDFLFSFGCLCHVSFDGISAYMANMFPKLRSGAHCFIMVADYDKLNRATQNLERFSILRALPEKLHPLAALYRRLKPNPNLKGLAKEIDDTPAPGRWYHAGIDKTCDMLSKLSYRVIDSDMAVNHRDPVIHFTKD